MMRLDVYHHLGYDGGVVALLNSLVAKGDQIMAQVDDLKAALDDVSKKVDGVGTEVADLITKLQAVNQNPAVDLGPAIAQAQGIAAKLAAIPPAPVPPAA
jgi:uncharacterized protein YoxC